jgi:hypothetical protein
MSIWLLYYYIVHESFSIWLADPITFSYGQNPHVRSLKTIYNFNDQPQSYSPGKGSKLFPGVLKFLFSLNFLSSKENQVINISLFVQGEIDFLPSILWNKCYFLKLQNTCSFLTLKWVHFFYKDILT